MANEAQSTTDDILAPPAGETKAKRKATKGKATKAKVTKPAKAEVTKPAKAPKRKAKADAEVGDNDLLAAPAKGKAAKPKAAKAASNGAARGVRGTGKFFLSPEDRESLGKAMLRKLRNPATTKDLASSLEVPTWQISVTSRALAAEGVVALERKGGVLEVSRVAA